MSQIKYSIVIPVYCSEKTIGKLLDALVASERLAVCEIIIADDASTDATLDIVARYQARVVGNAVNSGSARTRNIGIRAAAGQAIILLDSDVVPRPGALARMLDRFETLPKGNAVIGVYSATSITQGFIAEFKALYDFHLWERVQQAEVSIFEASCSVIDRDVLLAAGGFNERIAGADIENIELGYRLLAQGCRIILDKSVEVDHHFPTHFRVLARNYYRRISSWVVLLLLRGRFDNAGPTPKKALTYLFSNLALLCGPLCAWSPGAAALLLAAFVAYVWCDAGFLRMALRDKGAVFTAKSVIVQHALGVVVAAAVLRAAMTMLRGEHRKLAYFGSAAS